jgi:hypothetical protein
MSVAGLHLGIMPSEKLLEDASFSRAAAANVGTAKQRTWVLLVTLAVSEAGIAEFQKYDKANLVKKVLKSEQLLYAWMQRQPSRKWRQILS